MNWKRIVDASAMEVVVELGNCLIDELKVVWGSRFGVRGYCGIDELFNCRIDDSGKIVRG